MRSRRIKKQIWLNDEEEYIMKCKSQAVGMNASDYIRHLIVGYKPKEKPSEQFYEEIKNIRNIGNNINQIARIANAKGVIDVPHLKKEKGQGKSPARCRIHYIQSLLFNRK